MPLVHVHDVRNCPIGYLEVCVVPGKFSVALDQPLALLALGPDRSGIVRLAV